MIAPPDFMPAKEEVLIRDPIFPTKDVPTDTITTAVTVDAPRKVWTSKRVIYGPQMSINKSPTASVYIPANVPKPVVVEQQVSVVNTVTVTTATSSTDTVSGVNTKSTDTVQQRIEYNNNINDDCDDVLRIA